MSDFKYWESLLTRRYFAELAYFAGVGALTAPSAEVHMLAGIGCCGCLRSGALAQRLMDGDPVDDAELALGGLRVSPMSQLPFAGFDHLLAAFRADPQLRAPERFREVIDGIADDLAYMSRREIQSSERHSHRTTCVAAALLLRRLTGSEPVLPRIWPTQIEVAQEILAAELAPRFSKP